MSELYPLKFEPILKERIWGGDKLNTLFQRGSSKSDKLGESWEISSVENNISIVSNGYLSGNTLEELMEVYMGDISGDTTFEKFGIEFPLLFKLIDATEKLSIQVHPDDKMAEERYSSQGKSEMWYILDTVENAHIYCGLKAGITAVQFIEAANSGDPTEMLEKYIVNKGDVVYIPAGTIHAIGGGVVLAEIQQNSDVTYRIFDWNRIGLDGEKRKLHVEEAAAAIKAHLPDIKPFPAAYNLNQTTNLINCSHFITNILSFDKPISKDYTMVDSFVIYFCISGEYTIRWEGGIEPMKKGETLLMPAMIREITLEPRKESLLLEVFINNPANLK